MALERESAQEISGAKRTPDASDVGAGGSVDLGGHDHSLDEAAFKECSEHTLHTPSTLEGSAPPSVLYGDSSTASEPAPRSLLKASPPIPHGSRPGSYKIYLRRATTSQPFGLAFSMAWEGGPLIIAEDAPHIGIRKGDEVVKVNGHRLSSLAECQHALDSSTTLDLQLHHHEQGYSTKSDSCVDDLSCGFSAAKTNFKMPTRMRDLLLVSGPVSSPGGETFIVHIIRASLVQRFHLEIDSMEEPFSARDAVNMDEVVVVKQDAPQYGLLKGDKVLRVNGMPSASAWQDKFENSMSVWLECSRHESQRGLVLRLEAPSLEDLDDAPSERCSTRSMMDDVFLPRRSSVVTSSNLPERSAGSGGWLFTFEKLFFAGRCCCSGEASQVAVDRKNTLDFSQAHPPISQPDGYKRGGIASVLRGERELSGGLPVFNR
mmetsp:Transcript_77752/g.134904  ORF Transcript_77752/g.134904 Transcript_77752/m.134904 type:complete len:432 (+) Transcript_77752:98-1393(+)